VYCSGAMNHTEDIWRAASFLIEQHGPDAELAATRHTDWLARTGNTSGHLLWMRVLRALQELRRASPTEAKRPN
jgi:hypothetical protein